MAAMRFRAAPLLAALALAGCTGHAAVTQDVGAGGYQTVDDPALHWVDPADRSPVTGVTGHLLDGRPFDLSAWRGHVVVVNFWSSECAPCRDEAPSLEGAYRAERGHGVRFLGIDFRDDAASGAAFARDYHVSYPSLDDPSGDAGLHFGLGADAVPTTFVVDAQGRLAARHSGEILYSQLRDVVQRVLAEPGAG
jgi:thiol-disulfide isomerase/thioredoxin